MSARARAFPPKLGAARAPRDPAARPAPASPLVAAAALALLLAAAGPASAALPAPVDDDAEVRVLVLNLHAGVDAEGRDNLERTAELVRRTRADVVLLQEVDRGTERSGGVDQAEALSRTTGFEAVFGRTLDFQGGEYGLALLSRWPIRDHALVPLPVERPRPAEGVELEPRGVLRATLETPHGPLHVLNTHLDHLPDDGARREQLAGVLREADALRDTGRPLLLGGDLNDLPGSPVVESVREAGWTDAWERCGEGEGKGATFPSDAPERRIDYLFLSASLDCERAEVLVTEISDHRPILVAVTVPEEPGPRGGGAP